MSERPYSATVTINVLKTSPVSFCETVTEAFPAEASAREKLPLKELLFRMFSQSAETVSPELSVKVMTRVTAGEGESVPAVQYSVRVSFFRKTVVWYESASVDP